MIASLPMYWRDENAALWQAFWRNLRSAAARDGLDLPDLTPPEAIPEPWTAHWLRPDLALSMTCGLPFRTVLKDKVTYVGTLGFGLEAPPGHYRSVVIRHPEHRFGTPPRLACNAADSQSGWAAAQGAARHAGAEDFAAVLLTGSHAGSLAAVAAGRADLACLDAVSWRILRRFDPDAARVTVAGWTAPTPGLPLVTATGRDPAPLRRALAEAVDGLRIPDPERMGGPLSFHVLDVAAYHAVPVPPPPPGGD